MYSSVIAFISIKYLTRFTNETTLAEKTHGGRDLWMQKTGFGVPIPKNNLLARFDR